MANNDGLQKPADTPLPQAMANCHLNSTDVSVEPEDATTGTTIVGLVYKDGVILGARTGAQEGRTSEADINCLESHYHSPNIFCYGGETDADTKMIASEISLSDLSHRQGNSREIVAANKLLSQYQRNSSVTPSDSKGSDKSALVLAGVDYSTPYLCSIQADGSKEYRKHIIMGFVSEAASQALVSYTGDMTKEDAMSLLRTTIGAGTASILELCIIKPRVRDQYTKVMEQLNDDLNASLQDKRGDDASLNDPINFVDPDGKQETIRRIVNPLQYALQQHREYIKNWMPFEVNVLFVGMNGAPYARSGIPFGDEKMVMERLQINVSKDQLNGLHDFLTVSPYVKNGVTEQCGSGVRFWNFIYRHFKEDMIQFQNHCFVMNCSPLFFIGSGPSERRNLSLKKVSSSTDELVRSLIYESQRALKVAIELMKPKLIVAVGQFAELRVKLVTEKMKPDNRAEVRCIEHPAHGLHKGGDTTDKYIGRLEESLGDIIHETIKKAQRA